MVNILVADDDLDIRELVEMKLQLMGHDVITVCDGDQALLAVDEHDFDLVVLDVAMPGVTGIEVTTLLRDGCATRCMPIILMSAHSATADVRRGLSAGADDYVTKPFSPRDLGERIHALLNPCPVVHDQSLLTG